MILAILDKIKTDLIKKVPKILFCVASKQQRTRDIQRKNQQNDVRHSHPKKSVTHVRGEFIVNPGSRRDRLGFEDVAVFPRMYQTMKEYKRCSKYAVYSLE